MTTLVVFIFILGLCAHFVQLKVVSNFAKLDADDVCVFGEVKSVNSCPPSECESKNCQVGVVIRNVCVKKLPANDTKLVVYIKALGQTLHTLSTVNLVLTYPHDILSFFRISIWNLNGYHQKLLQNLPIVIPIDISLLSSKKKDILQLEIESECSCNANKSKDYRDFRIDELESCNEENEGKSCLQADGSFLFSSSVLPSTFALLPQIFLKTRLISKCNQVLFEQTKTNRIQHDLG